MARFLLTVLLLVTLFTDAFSFRGGAGRPLYGVIGDSFSANQGVPVRGLYNFGSRGSGSSLYGGLRK